MIDIASHDIATIEVVTQRSGDTKWIKFNAYNAKGEQEMEITLFQRDGKAIALKLGEDE
jgi:hypothetical protein